MKQKIFAICDLESSYAYHFMEHFERKSRQPFSVQAFTSVSSLELYLSNNPIDVLLISASTMEERVKQLNIPQIFILDEEQEVPEGDHYPYIYKYQSSDTIIKEAMEYYVTNHSHTSKFPINYKKAIFIGAHSPLSSCYQTTFALSLAHYLSKENKVIYLNLEELSGFEELYPEEERSDLSDVFYFMRQESGLLQKKLPFLVKEMGDLHYIPPFLSYEDIDSIKQEEWMMLLEEIGQLYPVVVIDFPKSLRKISVVFENCDVIFRPEKRDRMSRAKISQFEKLLAYQDVDSPPVIPLKIPYVERVDQGRNQLEHLIYGKMGEYIEGIVKEHLESIFSDRW
ncbi:MAG TPA: hypothetical protein IAC41_11305 [Candidatus Merdenecus merdavium]|nr:hypothetical protein [Candidatus Merdenecus merdavium]